MIEIDANEIATALYTLNKHAKVAPKLYKTKHRVLKQLLHENKAQKIGLHYKPNPGLAFQKLDVMIQFKEFLFHLPSSKEDKQSLKIIKEDEEYRNPKKYMSLKLAKQTLESYSPSPITPTKPTTRNPPKRKKYKGFSPYLNGEY